jgi:hypothetical protein
MMKKYLLAATAVVMTAVVAQAGGISDMRKAEEAAKAAQPKEFAYECAITKSSPASNDPSYKVVVEVNMSGFISILHTTASGKQYDRADQYTGVVTGPLRKGEDWSTTR